MKNFLQLLLLIPAMLCGTNIAAQDRILDIKVVEGQRYDHLIPDDMKYILPDFQESKLLSKYGEEFSGKVNASFLTNLIYLLTTTGDTLRIAESENIVRIISPNGITLQREKKFLRVIEEHRNIALCEYPSTKIDFYFENDITTEAISALEDKISLHTGSYSIIINELGFIPTDSVKIVTVRCTYSSQPVLVIEDRIYPCRLSSFTKAFPKQKKSLKDFAKAYNTDFSNKESLLMLFEYCVRLL